MASMGSHPMPSCSQIIQRDSVTAACAASLLPPDQAALQEVKSAAVAQQPPQEWGTSNGEASPMSGTSPPGSPRGPAARIWGPAHVPPMDHMDSDALSLDAASAPHTSQPVAAACSSSNTGSTVVGALSYDCNLWSHRGPRRVAVALSNPLMAGLLAAKADVSAAVHNGELGALVAPGEEQGVQETGPGPLLQSSPMHAGDVPGGALGPPSDTAGPSNVDAMLTAQVQQAQSGHPGFALLRTKAPRWHETYQCWCLDFGGRVTTASVKNFQLVASGHGRVLMQFGRTSHKDVFVMDFMVRCPLLLSLHARTY